jgi:hypothetical protein
MTIIHSNKPYLEAIKDYVAQKKGNTMNCKYVAFQLKNGKTICAAFDKLTNCNRQLEDFGDIEVRKKDEKSQDYRVERCSNIDDLIVQKSFPILALFKRSGFSPPYLGPHCYPEGEYKQGKISKAELIIRLILPDTLRYNEYSEDFFKLAYNLISEDKVILSKEQITYYAKFCKEHRKNITNLDIDALLKHSGRLYRQEIAAQIPPLSKQKAKEIKLKVFQKALRSLPKREYNTTMRRIFPNLKNF